MSEDTRSNDAAAVDGWEQHLIDQQRSWLTTTYAQRLEALESMIEFARNHAGAAQGVDDPILTFPDGEVRRRSGAPVDLA